MTIDEKTQQLFEQYKTNLENKFSVPLSDIKLRALNREFLDELMIGSTGSDLTSVTKRVIQISTGMTYYAGLNILAKLTSGCTFNHPLTKQRYILLMKEPCKRCNTVSLPIVLVHELSHMVAYQIWERGPKCLNPFIQEGFAEYVSLRIHKESYGDIDKIGDIIDNRIRGLNNIINNKQPMSLRENINQFMFKLLWRRSRETYGLGFLFFDELCLNRGFDPQDILKNPPASYEEITKPELYAKRRQT